MPSLGLVKRKEIWVPTWRGWVLLLVLVSLLGTTAVMLTVPFLSPIRPLDQGVLVVEGWLPDYALAEAKRTFENHSYRLMLVTGVPIEQGLFLTQERDYAQLAAATLKHLGMKPELIVPVSCPSVPRDRTYATARKVRAWLDSRSSTDSLDIFTLGVHARRTWLLYRIALGKNYHAGIIAGVDERYDGRRWWTTSSGFRVVTSELIAYVYAKLLFRPPSAAPLDSTSK